MFIHLVVVINAACKRTENLICESEIKDNSLPKTFPVLVLFNRLESYTETQLSKLFAEQNCFYLKLSG